MGWANCGTDSKGRPIGYAHPAQCDHPGCTKKIHRGLAHACGGDHGEGELTCEGYFCGDHMTFGVIEDQTVQICLTCAEAAEKVLGPAFHGDEPEEA
jgi:hypothetical protein